MQSKLARWIVAQRDKQNESQQDESEEESDEVTRIQLAQGWKKTMEHYLR